MVEVICIGLLVKASRKAELELQNGKIVSKAGIEIGTFRLRIRRATNHALRSHIHKIALNLILKLD